MSKVIIKYNEGKKLNTRDYRLYTVMAKAYTREKKYQEAISTLNEGIDALMVYKNNTYFKDKYSYLVNLRTKVDTIKTKVKNYNVYYAKLYQACLSYGKTKNVSEVEKILNTKNHASIASSSSVTYYDSKGRFVNKPINGMILAVYKNLYIYFGNWKNGKRQGSGYYMASSKSKDNVITYIYAGKWANNYPNGKGIISYSIKKNGILKYKTLTTGNFKNGYENGKMIITKYDKANYGKKTLTLSYTAKNGVLQYLKEKGKVKKTSAGEKIIGHYYLGKEKKEVVATKKNLVWKVQGLYYKNKK